MHIGPYVQVDLIAHGDEDLISITHIQDDSQVTLTLNEARQLRIALGVLLRPDDLTRT